VTRVGNSVTVSGPDGFDTLTNVEKLQFADTAVTLGEGPTRTDFDTNNSADILFWNDTVGLTAVWFLNAAGTAYASGTAMGNVINTTCPAITAGDFNDDGHTDILWQNTANGTPDVWLMNGTSFIQGPMLTNPGTAWTVKGTGDFNGDGNADILW